MLAIVGESGSGKSVMALTLMNLLSSAARVVQGSVLFSADGKEAVNLLALPDNKFRNYRGNQLAMIFQEPMTSLNPVMTCGVQLMEPLILQILIVNRQSRLLTLSESTVMSPKKYIINTHQEWGALWV